MIIDYTEAEKNHLASLYKKYKDLQMECLQIMNAREDALVIPKDGTSEDRILATRSWIEAGSAEWKEARNRYYSLIEEQASELADFLRKCEDERFSKLADDPQKIKDNASEQTKLLIQAHYDEGRKMLKNKKTTWLAGFRVYERRLLIDHDYIINQAQKMLYRHYAFFEDTPELLDNLIISIVEQDPRVTSEGDYYTGQSIRGQYDTLNRQEQIAGKFEYPSAMVVPTLRSYLHGMSFISDGSAYLQLLKATENIVFENGTLFLKDKDGQKILSEDELINLITKEKIEEIDLTTLRTFFGINLTLYEKTKMLPEVMSIPVKALIGAFGYKDSGDSWRLSDDEIINRVKAFHDVTGVIKNKNGRKGYYQVLVFHSLDNGILKVSCPYMNYLIERIEKASYIRDTETLTIARNKDGSPKKKPAYSYMIKNTIAKEKNKVAVENVVIIIQGLERAGSKDYNISYKKLVKDNILLAKGLEKAGSAHASRFLKRAFTKTWELLRDQTYLQERYEHIDLPDPNNPKFIPTLNDIETGKTIVITHGKKKRKVE